ncbi:Ankyrin repeat domain-containing protein 37 [Apodemus speciosus]|uniref:Ankyrin repeat domain-containing protein 37 n=1 Tax=Apodemus speciosus TaxID=105296 RepID=A0ABQ0F1U3_APOSI
MAAAKAQRPGLPPSSPTAFSTHARHGRLGFAPNGADPGGWVWPINCQAAQQAPPPPRRSGSRLHVSVFGEDGLKNLLETGASVNAPPDPHEQSPVHLAAGGGLACFLLWQLQTGADLNQQDVLGETPLHKAAKVGSLECLSLLVASDVQIDVCNKNGQTAEDLAWSCGFPECARFLTMIKRMQTAKSSSGQPEQEPPSPVLRQKRSFRTVESRVLKRKCWHDLLGKRKEEA